MKSLRRYIPEGTRDLIFEDCGKRYKLIDRLRVGFLSGGFQEVVTPSIEFFDVFIGESSSIEQERMYKFFDGQGRILVLRPDMTTPIGRIAATKLKDYPLPARICYSGNIFRVNDIWEGKPGEITQSGIEIIGAENPRADSEVIITAISSLLEVGLKNFQIELGQAEFFKGLIEEVELEEQQIDSLRELVEKKNFSSISKFITENEGSFKDGGMALKSLPKLFGGPEVLYRARSLTTNERAVKAIDNISDIYSSLEEVGLESYVSIDLGLVQHIDYYTGMVFRGYSSESGSVVISGGRYDNLISRFGRNLPATGFAINVDSLVNTLEMRKDEAIDRILVFNEKRFMRKAYQVAKSIRDSGFVAELSLFDDKKKSLDYGRERGFSRMLCIDCEDRVTYIDINTGSESCMDLQNLMKSMGD